MEMAQLLGFPCYADYVLKKRMAQTPERVYNLLEELKAHYLAPARREVEAVAQLAKEKEGADFVLMPWDFAHYAHLLKLRDYDLDAEMVRPYLELSKVVEAFSDWPPLYMASPSRKTRKSPSITKR